MKTITPAAVIRGIEEAATLTGLKEFFLVGMATSLFTIPRKRSHKSDDADFFTPEDELKNLDPVILNLGEGSDFQKREGFYIERVGSWTMLTQPDGWRERAKTIPHPTLKIQALSLIDLLYNKLEVNRPKDRTAIEEILAKSTLTRSKFQKFLHAQNVPGEKQRVLMMRLRTLARKVEAKKAAAIS